jgi:predicted Fe-Mo cluster-binding NifX family protein
MSCQPEVEENKQSTQRNQIHRACRRYNYKILKAEYICRSELQGFTCIGIRLKSLSSKEHKTENEVV